jgi:hypothetical protein
MPHQETITVTTPAGDELRQVFDNERETLQLVEDLHCEANEYRKRDSCGRSLEDQWETNGQRFLGNHWSAAGTGSVGLSEGYRVFHFVGSADEGGLMATKKAVLNRTQTALISNVASQTSQQVSIRFTPKQTHDKPIYMLSKEAGQLLGQMVQTAQQMAQQAQQLAAVGADPGVQPDGVLMGFTTEQTMGDPEHGPIAPISEQQADYVQQLILAGQLKDDALIAINDSFCADIGQQVFDNRWGLAMGDRTVVMMQYLANIFGHQPVRFQWHTEGQRRNTFTLETTHILNVWVDPLHEHIEDADYLIFDYMLSLDRAKAEWPKFAEDLDRAARDGKLDGGDYRHGGAYQNTDFRRKMVIVRTVWVRHQTVDVPEQEALEQGLVQPAEPTILEAVNPESGMLEQVENAPLLPYVLAETGEPTAPGEPNWPTKIGLRQIVVLPEADKVVEDVACPYLDIPFAWSVNIPIPYSMYGQGEPQRLEDIQQQVNRLLSILINYTAYFQFPQRYWKQSVLDRLRAAGVKIFSRPGAEIPIPDDMYDQLAAQGKMCMVQDIPLMPPQFINLLQLLLAEMDRMSGDVEVRQGVPPSASLSGKAIDSLRAESYGPLSFRSKFAEWAVERMARLSMDAIVKWMDEEVWQEILDGLSLPVIRMVRERLSDKRYDVMVEVSTGRGTTREQDQQRAVDLYQGGAPTRLISRETAMERLRIEDAKEEIKRIDTENAQAMMAAMPPAGDAPIAKEEKGS